MGILHYVAEARGEGTGRQVWAGMPLEGTLFGMTHATARSEVRGIKIGLCRERKGSSYRKYGTSVISHQALARSTAGPSASVHCRRNRPTVRARLPHCSPPACKRLPWHQVELHKPQRERENQEQVRPGWHRSPPRVGWLFICFFFNIRTVLLIPGTQGIAPYRSSIHHSTEWIPLKRAPARSESQPPWDFISTNFCPSPVPAEPVITTGFLGYAGTASLGALK